MLTGSFHHPCTTFLILAALAGCATAVPPSPPISLAQESSLFAETDRDLAKYHLDEVRPDQFAMGALAELSAFDPKISVTRAADQVVLRRGKAVAHFAAAGSSPIDAWSRLTAKVLATARNMSSTVARVPADRLDERVIDAGLARLDPYSHYVRPAVARAFRAAREGFDGIGVTLAIRENEVQIISVMPDTPAAAAGLRAGDRIMVLDGVPVNQLAPSEVRRHLNESAHAPIQLAVARHGLSHPLQVTLHRTIIIPNEMTLDEDGGVALLTLRRFDQQTTQNVVSVLHRAHEDLGPRLRGVILDLRNNPGGLLDQAVGVASLFLAHGEILATFGRNPRSEQYFPVTTRYKTETLPLAVLVNGGSASASEIVAAALQDSGRAVVIGTSSFGKGMIQSVFRTANQGELAVTWALAVTPGGYLLNRHGVVPTLCTARLTDNPTAVDALLSGPVPAALAQPRRALNDGEWRKLRALCPPTHEERRIDYVLARHLLANPATYRHVLEQLEPGPAGVAY